MAKDIPRVPTAQLRPRTAEKRGVSSHVKGRLDDVSPPRALSSAAPGCTPMMHRAEQPLAMAHRARVPLAPFFLIATRPEHPSLRFSAVVFSPVRSPPASFLYLLTATRRQPPSLTRNAERARPAGDDDACAPMPESALSRAGRCLR